MSRNRSRILSSAEAKIAKARDKEAVQQAKLNLKNAKADHKNAEHNARLTAKAVAAAEKTLAKLQK